MTESPLLPPGRSGPGTDAEATDAELDRMAELALARGARTVALGRGNSPAAARATDATSRMADQRRIMRPP